ncbi:PREDICTED: cyclic AMP-dependent transcription factor ATF-6 alpha [Nanorana parkeri]|uniref:cyclic AMP-dependent transcription factor ATF-6 alpha n=1 Tax=Nanorana parkeri TaxID=125878 RepID=UPI000854F1E8|nr:PREDICTED: cyclic AMP-dependent transcription factor ATF-6 alpha [Nanorana parkeri]
MAMEVENMCVGLQGPGPGGGSLGVPLLDDLLWSSSLFDELNNLVDVDDDLFQDGDCIVLTDNFDNLDFTTDLMPWNSHPLNEPCFTGDWNKPDPLSYASSSCSVDSPPSSSQFVPEETDISSSIQMSPDSLYSEASKSPVSSGQSPASLYSEASRSHISVEQSPSSLYSEASRSPSSPAHSEENHAVTTPTKSKAPVKKRKLPPVVPKTAIQPKAILIPSTAKIQPASGTTAKTIIFQPLTTLLPKQQPLIAIQSAPPAGQQVVLTPSAVVQLPTPGIVTAQPVLAMNGGATQLSTPSVNLLQHIGLNSEKTTPVKPFIHSSARAPDTEADISVIRRQQRMIKNRESAFQSRRKKKEYMQGLEVRLRAALSDNERLKKENGSLQKLLEEVVSENQKLKVTAPKRRAVCLMMVAVFLMLNFNPLSVLQSTSGEFDMEVRSVNHNRHLLEFSPGEANMKEKDTPQNDFRPRDFISTEKALMIVKEEPLLYIPPPSPPCRPLINQTQTLRLNQELRGWVHRHEAERTKTRRTISTHKAQAMQKQDGKGDASQLVTMQYTDASLKNSNELQIYYSSPRSYQDFLEAIRRRGDTFYVVSFRRDHLLLPATNRNKTTRPKMSIILPSMNVNVENVINGQEYEVMMQIDCEVMDTRILHVKSASIPPFLREHRENQTKSYYNSASSNSEQTHVLSTISESPL